MFIEKKADKNSYAQRKPVHGIGINDANYKVRQVQNNKLKMCPYYSVWENMLERCYSASEFDKNSKYSSCYVDLEWLVFSQFKLWMKTQDWKGKYLDKDLISPESYLYSSETCMFVTNRINCLVNIPRTKTNNLPLGVFYTHAKQGKRYRAQCSINMKSVPLGYYDTIEEASLAYRVYKSKHIKECAIENKDNQVLYRALIRHSKLVRGIL